MSRIVLALSSSAEPYARTVAHVLVEQFQAHGDAVLVSGSLPRLLCRLLRASATVVDLHGADAGLLAPFLRLLKRRTIIVTTLHRREELRGDLSLVGRLVARLGVWAALHTAHEVIATQKALQYTLLQKYERLPTYIPQGVKPRTVPRPRRARRWHALAVIGASPGDIRRIRRIAGSIDHRVRVIRLSDSEGEERARARTRARAVLVTSPLQFPGILRQLALFGHPIATLDTPEHREALSTRAVFFASTRTDALTAALDALLTHSTAERRARQAARVMERLYRWDVIAPEFLKTYRHADLPHVLVDSLSPRTAGS